MFITTYHHNINSKIELIGITNSKYVNKKIITNKYLYKHYVYLPSFLNLIFKKR